MRNGPFLMISGHDFRSKRKANVHFIAEQLAKIAKTRFFSIGFSQLSRIKKDPRLSLWDRSNRVETMNDVDAYLWRTLVHPFNLRTPLLDPLASVWFEAYSARAPEQLKDWIRASNTIILESGMAILFFELIKEVNPEARVIYLCSDSLSTIHCAPVLLDKLKRFAPQLDGIRVPSRLLQSEFSKKAHIFYVPHGIDPEIFTLDVASPFTHRVNLVSVGSMLFDRSFFEIAAVEFPDYHFYVIGGGAKAHGLSAPNITVMGEMPFKDTLPYLKHASAGIAPYESDNVAPYLIDTSMKLMQFEGFGIPAICPHVVVGGHEGRFGYVPGDHESIRHCIKEALGSGRFEGRSGFTWGEVTRRILNPELFNDTAIGNE